MNKSMDIFGAQSETFSEINPLNEKTGHLVRQEFSQLRDISEVSVLIIGGGINGIGLFRELALQGIDTLLVEKSDFCSETSAAMTRVIHGGLRYLENGEFRLVRESLRERNLLFNNAPHYIKPLPTNIPLFSWTDGIIPTIKNFVGLPAKPGNRGILLIKAGLTLYDFLAGRKSPLPRHRFRFRNDIFAKWPSLNKGVISTATYYDAKITYPERLCLELVRDTEASFNGAHALNYVRFKSASGKNVLLRDEVSGETCQIKPQIVVNATGAWIDFTNREFGHNSEYIGGTKGSHIVLDHQELVKAAGDDMIYFVNRDGRICFFYVVGNKIIAGATDIPVDDPEAICTEGEVDYIIEALHQVFPSIQVSRSNVVYRFCGVRPLPRSNALTPGQVSRDHSFPVLAPGNGIDFPIYSLVGGKWTTFRALAAQVTDEILSVLSLTRTCSSANIPIGGGKNYPPDMSEYNGLPQQRLVDLVERYGTDAKKVADYLLEGPDLLLSNHNRYSRREIEFLTRNEKIVHLDDLILRRTIMGMLGEINLPLLKELSVIISPVLKWSAQETEAEVERTVQLLHKIHGVTLAI